MIMFSIGNDSSSASAGIADSGSVDDSKPNSIYGGSVRQAARHTGGAVFQLQDLSPRSTGAFFNSASYDFDNDSYLDSMAVTAAASTVFGQEGQEMQQLLVPEPSSNEYEQDNNHQYILDNASAAAYNLFPAECCVERASASKRERYYFTMGKKPGGGGSAARHYDAALATGEEQEGRMSSATAMEEDEQDKVVVAADSNSLGVRVARHSTQSSSSTLSSSDAVPHISMHHRHARYGRTHQQLEHGVNDRNNGRGASAPVPVPAPAFASASASASSELLTFEAAEERQKRSHDIALKSAADLQREIFPHGVPSQGILKSGQQHIEADIRFRTVGCEDSPWHGFIIDDVLFMYVPEFAGSESSFRTAVMALMELAEDVLFCSSVIIALPRVLSTGAGPVVDANAAATLARAFMYSGFELVSPLLYQPSPSYVLLGYDAM
ncbi:hypothetical protein LPJ64_002941 [Coemansia asiatica]|uniref:Ornithine decarboxylase antizyme n=1 Tax=Coemansia asiatica TaxID=1052880 RepID=A0A9W8CJ81_9FUNG|nr:hypothetical protein LPJ64_002941 [Coemansia asiatica]